MSQKTLKKICIFLSVLILFTLIWGLSLKKQEDDPYTDGIEQIDINSIYLTGSKIQVDFSEILIGTQEETRKLIVSTQEATVSTKLTDRLIEKLDFDFLKKTQDVSYTGKGYFVVDLDNLTKKDILQDKTNQTVTICIDHSYLETIEIDPEKIIIEEVKEGLLAWGDIKLTVSDYNLIEKELRNRLEAEFDTVANGQNADTIALKMVKEIYEPIVKAIDKTYQVQVVFK